MDQSEIDATLAATYSLKRTHSWPPSQWYLDRFAEDPELPVTAFQELSQDINEARQSLTAPVEPSSIDRGCSRLAEKPSGSDWSESSSVKASSNKTVAGSAFSSASHLPRYDSFASSGDLDLARVASAAQKKASFRESKIKRWSRDMSKTSKRMAKHLFPKMSRDRASTFDSESPLPEQTRHERHRRISKSSLRDVNTTDFRSALGPSPSTKPLTTEVLEQEGIDQDAESKSRPSGVDERPSDIVPAKAAAPETRREWLRGRSRSRSRSRMRHSSDDMSLEELHMPFLFSIPSPPRFRERDLLDLYGGIQAAAGMPHQIRKRHANGRRKASKEPDRNLHDIREESNASQIFRDEEAARIRENAQRASRSSIKQCLFLRELLLYKDEMPTLKEALEEFPTDHTMPRHEHPGLISEFVNSYSAIGTKEEDEAMPKHYEHFPKWARDFTRNSELRRKANSQSANGGDASANGGEQQSAQEMLHHTREETEFQDPKELQNELPDAITKLLRDTSNDLALDVPSDAIVAMGFSPKHMFLGCSNVADHHVVGIASTLVVLVIKIAARDDEHVKTRIDKFCAEFDSLRKRKGYFDPKYDPAHVIYSMSHEENTSKLPQSQIEIIENALQAQGVSPKGHLFNSDPRFLDKVTHPEEYGTYYWKGDGKSPPQCYVHGKLETSAHAGTIAVTGSSSSAADTQAHLNRIRPNPGRIQLD
ncbi:MAG: hypothetical protein Q9159_001920 [Coniocarpon cinnabarinum]